MKFGLKLLFGLVVFSLIGLGVWLFYPVSKESPVTLQQNLAEYKKTSDSISELEWIIRQSPSDPTLAIQKERLVYFQKKATDLRASLSEKPKAANTSFNTLEDFYNNFWVAIVSAIIILIIFIVGLIFLLRKRNKGKPKETPHYVSVKEKFDQAVQKVQKKQQDQGVQGVQELLTQFRAQAEATEESAQEDYLTPKARKQNTPQASNRRVRSPQPEEQDETAQHQAFQDRSSDDAEKQELFQDAPTAPQAVYRAPEPPRAPHHHHEEEDVELPLQSPPMPERSEVAPPPPIRKYEQEKKDKSEVIKLARRGYTSSEIARRLRMSQDQVEFIIRMQRDNNP